MLTPMAPTFSASDVVADGPAFRSACERFESVYGLHVDDVWFGDALDQSDADLVADAALLNEWDCWLFFTAVCPSFSDWPAYVESGSLDTDEAAEALADYLSA